MDGYLRKFAKDQRYQGKSEVITGVSRSALYRRMKELGITRAVK